MDRNNITGVILAGGRSSRMGEDKGLIDINGQPLFEHIAQRLRPQVGNILISCNRNSERYGRNFQTVPDIKPDFSGPLAGMLAALSVSKTGYFSFPATFPLSPPVSVNHCLPDYQVRKQPMRATRIVSIRRFAF
jgi:molybdopterin-guanine dinucleotide biosynthesis protein A